jgi:hypothetical protein
MFCDFGARRDGGWESRPGRFTPRKDPVSRGLGGPRRRSVRTRKNLVPPPGFDTRTVQPVASRYTANVPDSSTRIRKRETLVISITWTLLQELVNTKELCLSESNTGTKGRLYTFILHYTTAPGWSMSLPSGFTITLIHTTLGRTTLGQWSVRRMDPYLTHKTLCLRRDLIPQS